MLVLYQAELLPVNNDMGEELNSREKGELATLKVQLEALRRRFIVSRPVIEGARYDLVIDDNNKLSRIQVKYAGGRTGHSTGAVQCTLEKNNGGKAYQSNEIDLLLVYIPQIDKICVFGPDIFVGRYKLNIRIAPSINNQIKGCINATDHLW